jgi:hypothetical protein
MIKMKIHNEGLKKLIKDLKRLRFDLLRESGEYIIDLSRALNESYTHSIDELVYEEYTPEKYERTLHLRGAHGALVQTTNLSGDSKSLSFYIDEQSVDPVDDATWKEKADNVEKGSTKMTVGFDRPFISETQDRLEWETKRMADALIRKYEQIIKRVGG